MQPLSTITETRRTDKGDNQTQLTDRHGFFDIIMCLKITMIK